MWIHACLCAQPICQPGPTAPHQNLHFSAGIQQTRCQVHISWVFYGIHRESLTVWFRPQFSATCQNELFHFCTTNARLRQKIKKTMLHERLGFHVLNENPMDSWLVNSPGAEGGECGSPLLQCSPSEVIQLEGGGVSTFRDVHDMPGGD